MSQYLPRYMSAFIDYPYKYSTNVVFTYGLALFIHSPQLEVAPIVVGGAALAVLSHKGPLQAVSRLASGESASGAAKSSPLAASESAGYPIVPRPE